MRPCVSFVPTSEIVTTSGHVEAGDVCEAPHAERRANHQTRERCIAYVYATRTRGSKRSRYATRNRHAALLYSNAL